MSAASLASALDLDRREPRGQIKNVLRPEKLWMEPDAVSDILSAPLSRGGPGT